MQTAPLVAANQKTFSEVCILLTTCAANLDWVVPLLEPEPLFPAIQLMAKILALAMHSAFDTASGSSKVPRTSGFFLPLPTGMRAVELWSVSCCTLPDLQPQYERDSTLLVVVVELGAQAEVADLLVDTLVEAVDPLADVLAEVDRTGTAAAAVELTAVSAAEEPAAPAALGEVGWLPMSPPLLCQAAGFLVATVLLVPLDSPVLSPGQ